MAEFESDHCPVCHKAVVVGQSEISEEQRALLGDKIYVPGETVDPNELTEGEKQQREDLLRFLSESRPEETQIESDQTHEG